MKWAIKSEDLKNNDFVGELEDCFDFIIKNSKFGKKELDQ